MPDFVIKKKEKKEYEQVSCRIESHLLEEVKHIVLDNNLSSVNEFINAALRFSIDNLKILEDTDQDWLKREWHFSFIPVLLEDSDLH